MNNKKFLKFIITGIIILVILSVWFLWRNVYSRDVLKLEILGPAEIEAGGEVKYVLRYKNNGNARLENSKLVFEYPENSIIHDSLRESGDENIIFRGGNKVEITVGEIFPGEEKSQEIYGYIFGRENTTATAKATMYFKPKNLNVEYDAQTTHTTLITNVPINFDLYLPANIDSDKEFSFDVNYFSKIDYPLSNLRIKVEYPSDFKFKSSRPGPSFEESEWEVGILNKGQGGRIEVSGIVIGEPSQTKIFKVSFGFWQDDKFVLLKESIKGIEIATPLIYITHLVNEKSHYVATFGEYLYYEIFFRNTGDEPLENLFMTAKLNRDIVDFERVQVDNGTFQKSTGTIIWDSKSIPELEFLSSMQESKVSFWVAVKKSVERFNPEIEVEVSLNQIKKRVVTKINSRMIFSQQVLFNQGPFNNYGPQPPKVGSLTSYAVRWYITNQNNKIQDLKVRATLPKQVRLSGDTHPSDARITFDSVSSELIWDVGEIEPNSNKEIYFQVILDPSLDQKGELAEIISEARASGKDSWTGTDVVSSSSIKKTDLPDDLSVTEEMGIIQ
jgi:hypothetical protein